MNWIVGIIGMVIAIVGTASCSGGPEDGADEPIFDFSSATPSEKQLWLEEQASNYEDRAKRTMGVNRPTVSNIGYKETKISVRNMEIQYIAQISRNITGSLPYGTRDKLLENMCSVYAQSQLSANRIKMVMKIVRHTGTTALSTIINTRTCRAHASQGSSIDALN